MPDGRQKGRSDGVQAPEGKGAGWNRAVAPLFSAALGLGGLLILLAAMIATALVTGSPVQTFYLPPTYTPIPSSTPLPTPTPTATPVPPEVTPTPGLPPTSTPWPAAPTPAPAPGGWWRLATLPVVLCPGLLLSAFLLGLGVVGLMRKK